VFIAAECSNAIHGDRGRPLSETPRLSAADWPRFGEQLSALAAYSESQGLRFAYHFHLGTVVERQEDLDRFIAHTAPNVGFVVDTGHAALGGVDAAALIRRYPGRVAHVHTKDVRRAVAERVRGEGKSFLDGVLAGMFTAPGDGDLDFDAVMRALAEIGYGGWIVIEAEQDPKLADPRVYSRLGLKTLKVAATAAGLIPAAASSES
jgi:inosose dehydratase